MDGQSRYSFSYQCRFSNGSRFLEPSIIFAKREIFFFSFSTSVSDIFREDTLYEYSRILRYEDRNYFWSEKLMMMNETFFFSFSMDDNAIMINNGKRILLFLLSEDYYKRERLL